MLNLWVLISNPKDCNSLIKTLKDSGKPPFGILLPKTIELYKSVLP